MDKKKTRLLIFGVILPMTVAGIAYYILFPEVIFARRIDSLLGTGFHPLSAGEIYKNTLLRLLRYYAFDAVWAFSLTSSLYLIMGRGRGKVPAYLTVTVAMAVMSEAAQLFSLFPGTFDVWDIAVEIVGALTGALIIKKQQEVLNQ